jgi:hypothetical protein
MENSSFGFNIPPWTCREILQNLKQGDSSVDEFSEAIQLLAPYVDDTSDNTMRHCLATNCHPYYVLQLTLVQDIEQMRFHSIKGLLKNMESRAIRLREGGDNTYGLPPLPNRKYATDAKQRLTSQMQVVQREIDRLRQRHSNTARDYPSNKGHNPGYKHQHQRQGGSDKGNQGDRGYDRSQANRNDSSNNKGQNRNQDSSQIVHHKHGYSKWPKKIKPDYTKAICGDCGQKGHRSKTFKGCPKHPDYDPNKAPRQHQGTPPRQGNQHGGGGGRDGGGEKRKFNRQVGCITLMNAHCVDACEPYPTMSQLTSTIVDNVEVDGMHMTQPTADQVDTLSLNVITRTQSTKLKKESHLGFTRSHKG